MLPCALYTLLAILVAGDGNITGTGTHLLEALETQLAAHDVVLTLHDVSGNQSLAAGQDQPLRAECFVDTHTQSAFEHETVANPPTILLTPSQCSHLEANPPIVPTPTQSPQLEGIHAELVPGSTSELLVNCCPTDVTTSLYCSVSGQ